MHRKSGQSFGRSVARSEKGSVISAAAAARAHVRVTFFSLPSFLPQLSFAYAAAVVSQSVSQSVASADGNRGGGEAEIEMIAEEELEKKTSVAAAGCMYVARGLSLRTHSRTEGLNCHARGCGHDRRRQHQNLQPTYFDPGFYLDASSATLFEYEDTRIFRASIHSPTLLLVSLCN